MDSDATQELFKLKKKVDSLPTPEVGIWIDWVPTVTQSGSVTVTVDYARYILRDAGKTVLAYAHLSVTGSGTAGSAIVIGGLPYNMANVTGNSNTKDGAFGLRDASVPTNYEGSLQASTATTFSMRTNNTAGGGIGAVPNLALASGDTIGFTIMYERA